MGELKEEGVRGGHKSIIMELHMKISLLLMILLENFFRKILNGFGEKSIKKKKNMCTKTLETLNTDNKFQNNR